MISLPMPPRFQANPMTTSTGDVPFSSDTFIHNMCICQVVLYPYSFSTNWITCSTVNPFLSLLRINAFSSLIFFLSFIEALFYFFLLFIEIKIGYSTLLAGRAQNSLLRSYAGWLMQIVPTGTNSKANFLFNRLKAKRSGVVDKKALSCMASRAKKGFEGIWGQNWLLSWSGLSFHSLWYSLRRKIWRWRI